MLWNKRQQSVNLTVKQSWQWNWIFYYYKMELMYFIIIRWNSCMKRVGAMMHFLLLTCLLWLPVSWFWFGLTILLASTMMLFVLFAKKTFPNQTTFHPNCCINHWKTLSFIKTVFRGCHSMQGWEDIICKCLILSSSYQYRHTPCHFLSLLLKYEV